MALHTKILPYLAAMFLLSSPFLSKAQLGSRPNIQGNATLNQRDPFANQDTTDTAAANKKKPEWDEEPAVISYKYLNSEVPHYYDSSLLFFHRNRFKKDAFYSDLGNWGGPAQNKVFETNNTPGLHLGYNTWEMYRYTLDSIPFINTTRPYTSFSFMLGSKEMQQVEILHTQNVHERLNFAFKVLNNTSEGFYQKQKANGLNAFISSNYRSENERYKMNIAFIYNNFKNDENGGIQSEGMLVDPLYNNRAIIPVNTYGANTGTSPMHNRMGDLQLFWKNNYAWGQKDSLYNEDSTQITFKFTPRFSLNHSMNLHNTRHLYTDALPQSGYYLFHDSIGFQGKDTLRSRQIQTVFDNKFSLNTYLGKDSQLVHVEAGLGIRLDWFTTKYWQPESLKNNYLSNYLFGTLRKDALNDRQWSYLADVSFFFSGNAIGNLRAQVKLSKNFPRLGNFNLGAEQSILAASYQQNVMKNNFFEIRNDFENTTNTQVYGQLWIKAINLQLGIKNQLVSNYIYLDQSLQFKQHSAVFSILQFTGRKLFQFGRFSLDNEAVWQGIAGDAPVHLPNLMLRHQLAYKLPMFQGKLNCHLGVEGRYHTAYYADGYNPVYNQFFYQNSVNVDNKPALAAFFNFKVKRLRAFVMGDQLQQMIWKKNIIMAPGYPAPNAHFRFGFNWIMMN